MYFILGVFLDATSRFVIGFEARGDGLQVRKIAGHRLNNSFIQPRRDGPPASVLEGV
jgi:hypothetical protein